MKSSGMENKAHARTLVITILQCLIGTVAVWALLSLIAWSLGYWQAWAFAPVFVIPMILSGYYYALKEPELLERRKVKWKSFTTRQKKYMAYTYTVELCLFVFPAVDHRFGWSHLPEAVSICGLVLILAANVIWIVSKRENPFAGAGITVYEGHRLIKTGPYAVLRHPNYAADTLWVLGIPLALGSWWGLLLVLLLVPAQVTMIFDEERFLAKNLPGYTDYLKEVRFRLIPRIW